VWIGVLSVLLRLLTLGRLLITLPASRAFSRSELWLHRSDGTQKLDGARHRSPLRFARSPAKSQPKQPPAQVSPYIRKTSGSPGSIDDPSYWHQRAEESRAMAQELYDPNTKAAMLKVAASYDDLARQAVRRSKFP
jgi:hypothetical protein